MHYVEVSVIIPVYNSENKKKQCIDSILAQLFTNYELVLINDGLTGGTLTILKEYEKRYQNIRVVDKENEGIAKTRNLGIQLAKGNYLVFIDNDDFIAPDYLQTFYDEIKWENRYIIGWELPQSQ